MKINLFPPRFVQFFIQLVVSARRRLRPPPPPRTHHHLHHIHLNNIFLNAFLKSLLNMV